MSTVGELLVKIGVNTMPLTAGIAQAKAEMRSLEGAGAQGAGGIAAVGKAAGIAGAAVAAGSAFIGVEAIKMASSFQSSMTLLRSQAGLSQEQVDSLSNSVLDLATTLPQSPEQLSAGLYHVVSAGYAGAQAMDILKTAAEGAAVGHADLESTTNALIASLKSGVTGIKDSSQAMGVLNAIVGAGNMRFQDLNDAMGTGILSTAKNYGVTINDVGAAMASMTTQGIPAIDAATRINSAMRLMAAPTSAAAKALRSVGLSNTALATDMRKPEGLLVALTDLQTHMTKAGLTATEKAALIAKAFGGKQSGAILTLIGNLGLLSEKEKLVADGAGSFGDSWTATQSDLNTQVAELKSSFQVLMISIGTGLIPAVMSVVKAVSPFINSIASWARQNPQLAGTILMVVGALGAVAAAVAFLMPLFTAVGAVLGAIGALLASPVLIPILAVVAAVALLATHWNDVMAGVRVVVDAIAGFVAGAGAAITGLGATVGSVFSGIVSAITGAIATVGSIIGSAIDAWVTLYVRIPVRIAGFVAGVIGHFVTLASRGLAVVTGFVGNVVSTILGIPGRIVGLITQLALTFGNAERAVAATVVTFVGDVVRFILGIPGKVIGGLSSGFANLARSAISAFMSVFGGIVDKVKHVIGSIPGIGAILGAAGNVGSALSGLIPHFATGAVNIPRDMLAFLHAGEMVVPAGPAEGLRRARSGATADEGGRRAGGPSIGTINVYNPAPEPASTSVRREVAKLQQLTAFGY